MRTSLPAVLLLLANLLNAWAEQNLAKAEVALKTDALVNLTRYVEWPAGAFVTAETPVMLGVYGNSGVHKGLIDAVAGKKLNGRRVVVRQFNWPQTPNCHVLFIAESERKRLPGIMKKIEHSTTLTVAAVDDFLAQGGIVGISVKEEKVRFHVNTAAAKEIGLKFSSKFLAVADQVTGKP